MTAINADELVNAVLARRAQEAGSTTEPVATEGRLPMWDAYARSGFARAWRLLGWLAYVAWRLALVVSRLTVRFVSWLFGRSRSAGAGPARKPAYRRRLRLP